MKQLEKTEGRICLYQLLNDEAQSQRKSLGYELSILGDNGKVQKSWFYETRELRWALEGFKTLVDAQGRNLLDRRDQWKPYKGQRRVVYGPPVTQEDQAA